MAKKIIFKTSFLVSGIMCFQGCGASIQECFQTCFDACKNAKLLPSQTQLIMDAEPQTLGLHRIFISIENNGPELKQDKGWEDQIQAQFKKALDSIPRFRMVDSEEVLPQNSSKNINWINIALNLCSGGIILLLSMLLPPSAFLSIGLTACSFLTTAYTAREYLINFFWNVRQNNLANMTSTVTLGWLLSLLHTLYHTITMPLISNPSMIFMCFIMPILLITVINCMDEIKQHILNQSKKMYLQGTKDLFPQMSEAYPHYSLTQEEQNQLSQLDLDKNSNDFFRLLEQFSANNNLLMGPKNALKQGMIIQIRKGECAPVDCLLIQENALIDASLLTGEPQQIKQRGEFIPAGAINLSQSVMVYTTKDSYSSTINQILFRSNRTDDNKTTKPNHHFTYLYSAFILVGMASSIIAPLVLGVISIPLILQNITGILFAVCPCTIAIAHQLPRLINLHQRAQRGILIRKALLCEQTTELRTVFFDKTGTLTNGDSEVAFSENISPAMWQRIYLLEKDYGADHPIAKAIIHYYETPIMPPSIIKDIKKVVSDPKRRGLSGIVQGTTLHIGNAEYLRISGINISKPVSDTEYTTQGFTPVYVAENFIYKGIIYIKHEIRKDILETLSRLKREGKKIIMLTGDRKLVAERFNQQNGTFFDPENIYADLLPEAKESLIGTLMGPKDMNPQGVWFIGDGLNDAPCAKMLSEQGGISCAITPEATTSSYSNICLNGSLDYLFQHNKLNAFLRKNVLQNQCLLIYGSLAFIAFIISFSIASIAVSPIIPLMVMVSTTLMILFNCYRVRLYVDNALVPKSSWLKQFLASDASLALLAGSSLCLMSSLLISTITTGGLGFPIIIFTAGATAALSSTCLLTSYALFALFTLLATAYLLTDNTMHCPKEAAPDLMQGVSTRTNEDTKSRMHAEKKSSGCRFWNNVAPQESSETDRMTTGVANN